MARFNFNSIALSTRADASKINENFNKIEQNAILKTDKATTSDDGLMSKEDKSKLNGIENGANNYTLPTAGFNQKGGVQTTSEIEDVTGFTPCPIVNGIPYYKGQNSYNDLANIPIINLSTIALVDGQTSSLEVGTYSIGGLTINGETDSIFNNSIVRCYVTTGNVKYISILAGNNMIQNGYNYYSYYYDNSLAQWVKTFTRITYGTNDIGIGADLATGTLYFVYEENDENA